MSLLVYFLGDLDAAKAAAPDVKPIRFCNAKFWKGEVEVAGTTKIPGRAVTPVLFDEVAVSEGVPIELAAEIGQAYASRGVSLVSLGGEKEEAPEAVTAKDLGWKLKRSPAEYLEKYPEGASAALAKEIVEKLGQ